MTQTAEQEAQALDFVYTGRRLNRGQPVAAIRCVLAPGKLSDEEAYYQLKSFKGYVLGGVYRGAEFVGTQVRGLNRAEFVERWADTAAQVDWRARDEQVEEQQRIDKLQKDAKKVHEIEAMMLPLRKLYEGYRYRRDSAGCEAFERAVLRALRVSPRAAE
ncbi:hypothetical protein [Pseudomonas protegens]|uniref:hypothetical protein n=1 Tax=Pseudomonas protegens TaxID=380021 RepID=UPI001B31D85C|nr:hypothetical protein [Pseudomonas protegens]